jgi:putative solute:sodium symporter small subunit
MSNTNPRAHRKACLRLTLGLLFIWFSLSYGCGILLRDWLDANLPAVGYAPFGFWMAQQGSIIGFILILVVYAYLMNRIDSKFGYGCSNKK